MSHARDVLGQQVVRAGFLDAPCEPASLDLLTMFGVLEHLPQPRKVAQRAFDLLKPGGVLAIETWNRRAPAARALGARWHVYDPPRCLWYHSERSLRQMFGDDRWECVDYSWAAKWISLRHSLAALEFTTRPVARIARTLLGGPRLASIALPYTLGDMVFAVFRKRSCRSTSTNAAPEFSGSFPSAPTPLPDTAATPTQPAAASATPAEP